jgi:hypothetical protein
MKILQVAVTIDEARQNGLPADIDHFGAGGDRHCVVSTHSLKPAVLNYDDAIFDRRAASAVDQFSTLDHLDFLSHVFASSLMSIGKNSSVVDSVI